jgi:hypothetical protein
MRLCAVEDQVLSVSLSLFFFFFGLLALEYAGYVRVVRGEFGS